MLQNPCETCDLLCQYCLFIDCPIWCEWANTMNKLFETEEDTEDNEDSEDIEDNL